MMSPPTTTSSGLLVCLVVCRVSFGAISFIQAFKSSVERIRGRLIDNGLVFLTRMRIFYSAGLWPPSSSSRASDRLAHCVNEWRFGVKRSDSSR